TITVVRTDNTNQVSSVNFATSDGTAQSGIDYFPTNGVMVFTNGDVAKTFTVTILANTVVQPDKTVLLQLSSPANAFLIAPYAATLTIHDTSGSLVVPAGSILTHESLVTNGIIDPGENVTMLLALRASGGTNIPTVYATLLATNGITSPVPATPVYYGGLTVGGPSASRQFSFTANGTNGQQVLATLLINNGVTNIGTAAFSYTLGMWTNTFYSTNIIIIPNIGMATPYPSTIAVSNLAGTIVKTVVTLSNLSHTYPQDVNVLLVSPSAQDTLLMSHAGGSTNVAKITLTFDDAATNSLPSVNVLTTGTNKPTSYFSTPVFP
ncbi:MAG TPA: Calx-beta domain-containing protein, partial [Candidatus Dormibacteraeota bacterium]|nr:Calx-beta domain-containing protein [Candidatus Dormibacteraeota bacterium]